MSHRGESVHKRHHRRFDFSLPENKKSVGKTLNRIANSNSCLCFLPTSWKNKKKKELRELVAREFYACVRLSMSVWVYLLFTPGHILPTFKSIYHFQDKSNKVNHMNTL